MTHINMLQEGLGLTSFALTINRAALGTFFSISGYHKLFNKQRHASVVATLKACHVPCLGFNQWFVPSVEFLGGLSLISGVLAPFASLGLIAICLVAVLTDGLGRIPSFKPLDRCDWLDDLLYLPEVLYLIGLTIVVGAGPGALTLAPAAVWLVSCYATCTAEAGVTLASVGGAFAFIGVLALLGGRD